MSAFQKASTTVLPRTAPRETGAPIHSDAISGGAVSPASELNPAPCALAQIAAVQNATADNRCIPFMFTTPSLSGSPSIDGPG
jgi:hypothetical protein